MSQKNGALATQQVKSCHKFPTAIQCDWAALLHTYCPILQRKKIENWSTTAEVTARVEWNLFTLTVAESPDFFAPPCTSKYKAKKNKQVQVKESRSQLTADHNISI